MWSSRHDLKRLIILGQIDGKRAWGRAPARWSDAVKGQWAVACIALIGDVSYVVTILSIEGCRRSGSALKTVSLI
ncbi:unnamed protein product, partial [Iphiclides podalirius]